MWQINKPQPVKLFIGILAADENAMAAALEEIENRFGKPDILSETRPFTQTNYYRDQTGPDILRKLLTIEKLIDPGCLAEIKHNANDIEQDIADRLAERTAVPRPVNIDPGIIEPSKLVLASTKNFAQRIYIGSNIYAELTLMYIKGKWQDFQYTYPDYKLTWYHDFLSAAREKLVKQLRQL